MNLPENGRVVIIDDSIDESLPLIQMLSKKRIPTTYFDGDYKKLPELPLDAVRIVFLDLNFNELANGKTSISSVMSLLDRILSPENGPYLIILWSKNSVDFSDELVRNLNKKEYKPSFILDLEKTIYINTEEDTRKRDELISEIAAGLKGQFEPDEINTILDVVKDKYIQKHNSKKRFVDDALDKIEEKLKEKLQEAGVFHLFFIWENIVHKSAGDTLKTVERFFPVDTQWESNVQNALYNMAKASMGKQLGEAPETSEIINASLITFNEIFMDILVRSSKSSIANINLKFENKENLPTELKAKINSILHLDIGDKGILMPGNVYEIDDNSIIIEELFRAEVFNDKSKAYNDELVKNISQFKKIMVEVSPFCDYAQNKWKNSRCVIGFACPVEYTKAILSADYTYSTPILTYDGKDCHLVFDLRLFKAMSFEEISTMEPKYRIKQPLVMLIQSNLSRHMGRQGILTLG